MLPATVTNLRQRLLGAAIESNQDDAIGGTLQVLVSSRGDGVFMVSGVDGLDCVGWILDALNMNGRLLFHQEDDANLDALRECLNIDLRLSVHAQPFVDFMNDVERHRFEVVVLCRPVRTSTTILRALKMIADGGFLVLPGFGEEESASFQFSNEFVTSSIATFGTLVCRRLANSRPSRKGGRRRPFSE